MARVVGPGNGSPDGPSDDSQGAHPGPAHLDGSHGRSPDDPQSVVGLIYRVSGDPDRVGALMRLLLVSGAVVAGVLAADQVGPLVPATLGGVVALYFAVRWVVRWVRSRQ